MGYGVAISRGRMAGKRTMRSGAVRGGGGQVMGGGGWEEIGLRNKH